MSDLVKLLKEEMKYKEKVTDRCEICVHSSEECRLQERIWHRYCNYNKIASFRVKDEAVCERFSLT